MVKGSLGLLQNATNQSVQLGAPTSGKQLAPCAGRSGTPAGLGELQQGEEWADNEMGRRADQGWEGGSASSNEVH